MATREDDRMAAIKRKVLAGSPAPCAAVDEIRRIAARLDRAYALHAVIKPTFEKDIIAIMWTNFGMPDNSLPWPISVAKAANDDE